MSQDFQMTLRPREAGAQFREAFLEVDEPLAKMLLHTIAKRYPDAYDVGIRMTVRAFLPLDSTTEEDKEK